MVQGSLQVVCSQAIPADNWMLEQASLVRIISIPHQMLQCPLSSHLSSSPDLYCGSVKNFPSWRHVKGGVTWVVASDSFLLSSVGHFRVLGGLPVPYTSY